MKGIVAGVVTVCVLGGLCLWMFSGGDDAAKDEAAKGRGRIKEVAPAKAPKGETEAVKTELAKAKDDANSQTSAVETLKKLEPPKTKPPAVSVTLGVDSVTLHGVSLHPKRIFPSYAENYVADILTTQPGDPPPYGMMSPRFDEEFKASMKNKIKILDTDTEEEKQLKQDMIDTKNRLYMDWIEHGISPASQVAEARKELAKQAEFRTATMTELANMQKSGATEEEIRDYVAAANKILEKNNTKAIKLPFKLRLMDKIKEEQAGK